MHMTFLSFYVFHYVHSEPLTIPEEGYKVTPTNCI